MAQSTASDSGGIEEEDGSAGFVFVRRRRRAAEGTSFDSGTYMHSGAALIPTRRFLVGGSTFCIVLLCHTGFKIDRSEAFMSVSLRFTPTG